MGALHTATWMCDQSVNGVRVMTLLSDHGADLNLASHNLTTPLHYAVYFSSLAAIEALVWGGADTSVIDKNGNTPLRGNECWLYKPASAIDSERIRLLLEPKIRSLE
eukprot:GDKJ01024330.1.p1 GENE.GDKJ01024330.1~~GDKJ01024330.1.p1  ORF type:complete len:107 (+),score=3.12 GDKJ01024330.1:1-321(+)